MKWDERGPAPSQKRTTCWTRADELEAERERRFQHYVAGASIREAESPYVGLG